ncbi:MAG: hypothetical protein MJ252_06470 [archaeon]|nr:hypothetical protein [archaeon]
MNTASINYIHKVVPRLKYNPNEMTYNTIQDENIQPPKIKYKSSNNSPRRDILNKGYIGNNKHKLGEMENILNYFNQKKNKKSIPMNSMKVFNKKNIIPIKINHKHKISLNNKSLGFIKSNENKNIHRDYDNGQKKAEIYSIESEEDLNEKETLKQREIENNENNDSFEETENTLIEKELFKSRTGLQKYKLKNLKEPNIFTNFQKKKKSYKTKGNYTTFINHSEYQYNPKYIPNNYENIFEESNNFEKEDSNLEESSFNYSPDYNRILTDLCNLYNVNAQCIVPNIVRTYKCNKQCQKNLNYIYNWHMKYKNISDNISTYFYQNVKKHDTYKKLIYAYSQLSKKLINSISAPELNDIDDFTTDKLKRIEMKHIFYNKIKRQIQHKVSLSEINTGREIEHKRKKYFG